MAAIARLSVRLVALHAVIGEKTVSAFNFPVLIAIHAPINYYN